MNKIVIFGNGNTPIKSIKYLLDNQYDLLIIPDPNDPGKDDWQMSLLKFCIDNNIPHCVPKNFDSTELFEKISKYSPNIILSMQCRKLIKKNIIDLVKGEIFNFHFANLPKNRGCYPGLWHILNGDKYAGVTLHKLTEGIDNGNIIDKITKKITIEDTGRSIYDWCVKATFTLTKKNIKLLIKHTYYEKKQDDNKASYYSRNSIVFNDLFVNWNRKSTEVSRFIQTFTFPPFQYPKARLGKNSIEIKKIISVTQKKRKALSGTILSALQNILEVQTKNSSVVIEIGKTQEQIKPGYLLYK